MKKPASIALLVSLLVVYCAAAMVAVAAQVKAVGSAKVAVAPNPITDVKSRCCGGSMGAARVCVEATIVNITNAPVTFDTTFFGMKAGVCIQWDKEYCKKHPPTGGKLCVDPCIKTSPPTPVTVDGPKITVPAKGSVPLSIVAPNSSYGAGSTLKIGKKGSGEPSHHAAVPPIKECVL
jgi:hypothetical protein